MIARARLAAFTIAALSPALLGLSAWAPAVRADDEVRVRAEVDARAVMEGESFNLTITVSGPARGIGTPALPDMPDLEFIGSSSSSNFSWINGQASSSKTFTYTFVPMRVGGLEIPAIAVEVQGKSYQTQPITLEVKAAGSQAPGGPAPRGQIPGSRPRQGSGAGPAAPPADARDEGDSNVFIRSWTDKQKAYVGQQITHHFGLYRDPQVRFTQAPQYSPPDLTGFWSESLGDEISGYRQIKGREYATTELRTALFPSEPGKLTIGEASVQVRMRDGRRSWDIFDFDGGRYRVLPTQPITVEVQPLPTAGRPADFSGTVAQQVTIESRIDPGPYEVGKPVTLTVELNGYGNPRTFAEPTLAVSESDFKLYDPDLQSETKVDEERIRVHKRYTRVLVPQREGQLVLPGVVYSYFDPEAGRYQTKSTRDMTLPIFPSTSKENRPVVFSDLGRDKVALLGQDIHHIKTEPLLAGDGARFPRSGGFWTALVTPWPLLAFAWVWRTRRDRALADQAGTRARGAHRAADKRLRAAEAARQAGNMDAFCMELSRALRGYLADRLNLAAAGLTTDEIDARLAARGVPEALRGDTVKLLQECDYARYAPGGDQAARMERLVETAGERLDSLEGILGRRRGGRRGPFAALLPVLALMLSGAAWPCGDEALSAGWDAGSLFLPAAAQAAPAGAEAQMSRAAAAYEDGDFGEAAQLWQALADQGLQDSRLWYNLGDAYYQQGRMGPAILAYRRALRLAPRDKEIRENLALARGRLASAATVSSGGRVWTWLRGTFSAGEMVALAIALLWIGTGLALLGIFRRIAWARLRPYLAAVAVLLPLIAATAWRAERQDWNGREAVLLAPTVNVQSGPGDDYVTLLQLSEGAEMRLEERRGGWARVRLAEDLEGWVPLASVEAL